LNFSHGTHEDHKKRYDIIRSIEKDVGRPIGVLVDLQGPKLRVGAFAAGHIMNTRTAHSQLMGGMIWGISSALYEATEIDKREARYINDNLADYLIPVNADTPQIDVILVPETDDQVNPAGVKGMAEFFVLLGTQGVEDVAFVGGDAALRAPAVITTIRQADFRPLLPVNDGVGAKILRRGGLSCSADSGAKARCSFILFPLSMTKPAAEN